MKKLYGVITAMTTPFTADNKVDVAALEAQTEYLIQKGVQCLYPCGTTGEMYLMSAEERELVAETVVKKAAGRVTVFIHVGAMDQDTFCLRAEVPAFAITGWIVPHLLSEKHVA